jgi:hypothetical protein
MNDIALYTMNKMIDALLKIMVALMNINEEFKILNNNKLINNNNILKKRKIRLQKIRKYRKNRNQKKIKKRITKKHNETQTYNQTQLCICDTICPKMDDDNRFNGLVLPLAHGMTIWYFSYLHIFTSYYAFYNQYYVLCFFGLGSLGTSLNYWKYPLHDSWRRYFDIAFIQLTFYIHMYYAFLISSGYGYMFFTGTGIICYGISNSYTKKNIYFATFFHILVHVFASIGNAVLYSGTLQ